MTFDGGPLDGAAYTLPQILAEGQTIGIVDRTDASRDLVYRRQGGKLKFLGHVAVLRFQGGPLDGGQYPTANCSAPEGEAMVVPLEDGRFAWYNRLDSKLVYAFTCNAAEMERLPKEDSCHD